MNTLSIQIDQVIPLSGGGKFIVKYHVISGNLSHDNIMLSSIDGNQWKMTIYESFSPKRQQPTDDVYNKTPTIVLSSIDTNNSRYPVIGEILSEASGHSMAILSQE